MDASSSIFVSNPAKARPEPAAARAGFPWALAGFLLLAAVTEVWALGLPAARPGDFLNQMIAAKKNLIPALVPQDILVFGDSSCAYAVDPIVLSNETGLSAFSFATVGDAAMPMNYFYLQDYLKTHKQAPRYLILMNTFDAWQRGANSQGVIAASAMHYPERVHGLWLSPELPPSLKLSFSNFAKFAVPSQARRFILRQMIEEAKFFLASGLKPGQKSNGAAMQKALVEARGSYRWLRDGFKPRPAHFRYKPGKQWTRKAGEALPARLAPSEIRRPYFVSQVNRRYLRLFLKAAESRGIRVLICHPPMMRSYYLNPGNNENISSYLHFLAGAARSSKAAVLLTDDLHAVPANRLYDSNDHLRIEASAEYTRQIARRMKALSDF